MLQGEKDGSTLDFQPAPILNDKYPRSVAKPDTSTEKHVALPAVVHLKGDEMLELATNMSAEKIGGTFWEIIRKNLRQWEPLLSDNEHG